jgi:hypothetical protein
MDTIGMTIIMFLLAVTITLGAMNDLGILN